MRLLYTTSEGTLERTGDLTGDKIPPYAILSHTWKEGHEVTFDDLKNVGNVADIDSQSSEGYQKLRFCAEQAMQHGLDYFWVDTCCIHRSNSTELAEAINSMFRWYQNAVRCYVYLSDVENDTLDGDGTPSRRWKPTFKKSRWFTRGWTLQELLAPTVVEFYSREGALLGTKETLEQTIHELTGIPIEALSGCNMSDFSVDERFSWAEQRKTTREEDKAYCLFGIFGLHLPLIYGEGEENALDRLRFAVLAKNKDRSQNQEAILHKICHWLAAPDPSTNYHKALKQRQATTGLWLLESTKFAKWKRSTASRLWLYGIPGCGKTILSSTIIEHLLQHCHDDNNAVTIYFYFDFNDTQKQDPELMIRSLLCQLLRCLVLVPKGVDAFFSSYRSGQRPSLPALLDVTRQAMQQFTHVYVVLDALDECTQRSELMDVLETVAEWQLNNVHLLMTSRKERDIERSLGSYVEEEDTICLQRKVVDNDIQLYVQQRLSNDKDLTKWNQDVAIRQEIETAMMRGARGMFRWAVCQLDVLGKCRNRAMLRKSLTTLPQTLDETYDRILCAISKEDCVYAMRILQWLTFSEQPLSVKEIAEIIAIDVARDPAFERDEVLEDPLEVLDICSSLVTVATNMTEGEIGSTQRIISLAHYSVQEYLVSDRIAKGSANQFSMQGAECHVAIAKSSLAYLMQFQQPLTREILEMSALARYTAKFWSTHLRKSGDKAEGTSRLAIGLLSVENSAHLTWIQLWNPDEPWKEPDLVRGLNSVATPLYYGALLGLSAVTKVLLEAGAEVNARGGEYGYALQAASEGGHKQVVKMLLEAGAEVNAQGGEYGYALQAASEGGHEQVVKMLLEAGAEVNAQGGEYGYALQAASLIGHEQVIKMLLEAGAKVNAQGGEYGYALQAASFIGHEQVIKMLLEAGAKVNAQGGEYGYALQAASFIGHEQVIKMLLEAGAKVNAGEDGEHGTALQAASERGHEQVVKMLLEAGAEVNASKSGFYGTALEAASGEGHEQVVKMLLEAGAELNARKGRFYSTALQTASQRGREQVVKMLLKAGAEVNARKGRFHGTALQAALRRGHNQVVKILLEAGAHQLQDNNPVSGPQ